MPQRLFSPSPTFPSSPTDLLSSPSVEDDSPEDPFSADSAGAGSKVVDNDTLQNTLKNSGNLQSNTGLVGAMPGNPFKKTLASLGTESAPGPLSQGSQGRSMEAESKTTRMHYDVEDFKKLLLSGEKSGSGVNTAVPPPVSFQSRAHVGDSSSNTDTSSISRQSIFESVSGPVQESPRTSHESELSDDERQRLVRSITIASEKVKPVTPRHRHGKLVKSNAPQTVCFEDPTLSFFDAAMSAMAPIDRSMQGIPSSVDKPLPRLPSLPNTQRFKQDPNEPTDSHIRGSCLESEQPQSSNSAQKRNPPAPPFSRRHSQLRAKNTASHTERSTPITEEAAADPISISQSPPTASSKPPPPPPPRRAGLVRCTSSSSVPKGAPSTPMSDQSNTADVNTRSAKPRPPIPPTRSPSVSSVKRPNQTQSIPGSPSMAPLPPVRRRGSSQSSYTPSRLSGYYTERGRSDSSASSISHLVMTPGAPSGAENKDVMADLSALQREVDELRGKFKD